MKQHFFLKAKSFSLLLASLFSAMTIASCVAPNNQVTPQTVLLNQDLKNLIVSVPKHETLLASSVKVNQLEVKYNDQPLSKQNLNFNAYLKSDDKEGTLIVNINLQQGSNTSYTQTLNLSGFKKISTIQQTKASLDAEINKIDFTYKKTAQKESTSPSSVSINDFQITGLNQNKNSIKCKIDLVPNDFEGALNVSLTLISSLDKQIFSDPKIFNFEDFKIVAPKFRKQKLDINNRVKPFLISNFIRKNKNDSELKAILDKYTEAEKSTENKFKVIRNNPTALWVYAVNVEQKNSSKKEEMEAINLAKAVVDATATQNPWNNITATISRLPLIVSFLNENAAVSKSDDMFDGIKYTEAKTIFQNLIKDLITNYYWGVKNRENKQEKQKIYNNNYEIAYPEYLNTLLWGGFNYLTQNSNDRKDLISKYFKATKYFLINPTKTGANEKENYATLPHPQDIKNVQQVIQNIVNKIIITFYENDRSLLWNTFVQFAKWMKANPTKDDSTWMPGLKSDETFNNKLLRASFIRFRLFLLALSLDNTIEYNWKKLATPIMKYVEQTLLKTHITKENVDDKENLYLLAVTTSLANLVDNNNVLKQIKKLLKNKKLSNLSKIPKFFQSEIEKIQS